MPPCAIEQGRWHLSAGSPLPESITLLLWMAALRGDFALVNVAEGSERCVVRPLCGRRQPLLRDRQVGRQLQSQSLRSAEAGSPGSVSTVRWPDSRQPGHRPAPWEVSAERTLDARFGHNQPFNVFRLSASQTTGTF